MFALEEWHEFWFGEYWSEEVPAGALGRALACRPELREVL